MTGGASQGLGGRGWCYLGSTIRKEELERWV